MTHAQEHDAEAVALRQHAVGYRAGRSDEPEGTLAAVGTLPTCSVHPDTPSYITCRECATPSCAACREVSDVGLLCSSCAKRERETDGIAVAPRVAWGAAVVSCVAATVGAATVLSPALARELAFAPFTLTSSPWRIVTGLFAVPMQGFFALVLVVVPLWFALSGHEQRRGRLSMAVVLGLGGLAGFTMLFVLSDSAQATWTVASGTFAAGTAALAISACWPHPRHVGVRPWLGAVVMVTGIVMVTALGIAPAWQIVGGLVMGILLEAVYALTPKPQRHPLPLFIGLGIGILVIILTLIVVLFVRT